MLYSYDIFDTCLLRACGDPLNVFDILSQRILGSSDATCKVDFAKERADGELRARKALPEGHEDVTIQEIYNYCDFSVWTDVSKETILATELKIERELLSPVFSIREQIRKQRNAGNQIVFISDMYLPEDFIISVLKEHGFYEKNDKVYISSEKKKTKATGHLFEFVKNDCNAQYSKWIHYGDNKNSDVKIPKRYGIKAKHIQHRFTYYESKLKDKDYACRSYSTAYMASISKAIAHKYENNVAVLFAADLIAPMYVSYVYYLLFDAKKRGLQHLYFLARDGYLLYRIAQEIVKTYGDLHNIELNYLYVSRESLYAPGFEHDDCSEYVRNQSDLCYRYFQEQGLTRKGSAIIDLRGTRKCHVAINNILQRYGALPVFAYYIEVMPHRAIEGDYDALLFGERFKRNLYNNYFLPAEIFEQYFSITTQKRTSSYTIENGRVVPVFEDEVGDTDFKRKSSEVNNKICMDFVQFLSCMNPERFDFKSMFYATVSVYSDFARAPSYKYLKAIEGLVVSDSPSVYYYPLRKKKNAKCSPKWNLINKIYNSAIPCLWTGYYRVKHSLIRHLQGF